MPITTPGLQLSAPAPASDVRDLPSPNTGALSLVENASLDRTVMVWWSIGLQHSDFRTWSQVRAWFHGAARTHSGELGAEFALLYELAKWHTEAALDRETA